MSYVTIPTSQRLVPLDSDASTGGSPTETLVVDGLRAADQIVAVTQVTPGANPEAVLGWSGQDTDELDVEWTGDPGAGAVVRVLVMRF